MFGHLLVVEYNSTYFFSEMICCIGFVVGWIAFRIVDTFTCMSVINDIELQLQMLYVFSVYAVRCSNLLLCDVTVKSK
jgi:hypothetical protein